MEFAFFILVGFKISFVPYIITLRDLIASKRIYMTL